MKTKTRKKKLFPSNAANRAHHTAVLCIAGFGWGLGMSLRTPPRR